MFHTGALPRCRLRADLDVWRARRPPALHNSSTLLTPRPPLSTMLPPWPNLLP